MIKNNILLYAITFYKRKTSVYAILKIADVEKNTKNLNSNTRIIKLNFEIGHIYKSLIYDLTVYIITTTLNLLNFERFSNLHNRIVLIFKMFKNKTSLLTIY